MCVCVYFFPSTNTLDICHVNTSRMSLYIYMDVVTSVVCLVTPLLVLCCSWNQVIAEILSFLITTKIQYFKSRALSTLLLFAVSAESNTTPGLQLQYNDRAYVLCKYLVFYTGCLQNIWLNVKMALLNFIVL